MLLVCQSKPIAFFLFSLLLPSSLLNLSINFSDKKEKKVSAPGPLPVRDNLWPLPVKLLDKTSAKEKYFITIIVFF